jgi:hypothetical protein
VSVLAREAAVFNKPAVRSVANKMTWAFFVESNQEASSLAAGFLARRFGIAVPLAYALALGMKTNQALSAVEVFEQKFEEDPADEIRDLEDNLISLRDEIGICEGDRDAKVKEFTATWTQWKNRKEEILILSLAEVLHEKIERGYEADKRVALSGLENLKKKKVPPA